MAEEGGNEVFNSASEEFVVSLSKKIRNLTKKLTQIERIEEKKKKGEAINAEQEEALKNKDSTVRIMKELQEIKAKFEKLQTKYASAETKEVKKEVVQEVEKKVESPKEEQKLQPDQLRDLLLFIQVSQFFDTSDEGLQARNLFWKEHQHAHHPSKNSSLSSDQDIDALNFVTSVLIKKQPNIESSLLHAHKLLNMSNDNILEGVSYRLVRERANELKESQVFLHGMKGSSSSGDVLGHSPLPVKEIVFSAPQHVENPQTTGVSLHVEQQQQVPPAKQANMLEEFVEQNDQPFIEQKSQGSKSRGGRPNNQNRGNYNNRGNSRGGSRGGRGNQNPRGN